MAVDTRDRRMSMIGLTKAFVRLFKNPAVGVDAIARAMLLFIYPGILPAPPAVATPRTISLVASRSNTKALIASRSNTISLVARES